MTITKYEQSGLILETEAGYRIAIDIGAYTPVEKLEGVHVDAVFVSHLHGDHFSKEQIIKLSPKKVYLNEECIELLGAEKHSFEVIKVSVGDVVQDGGVKITFFEVDHGPNVKVKPKENFGFLIEVDGQKIYFGGDIFYPSGMDVSKIEVDIALLPVGGFYTFGPDEALSFAKQFKNIKKILPMHYENSPETCGKFTTTAVEAGFYVDSFV